MLQEHHLFHKGSAVLPFHTLTQNPLGISAKFTHSFLTKLHMNSQGMCCQSFNKTFFFEKQNIVNIFINIMLQYSDWRTAVLSFSVCTFLSPPNTHFLHAKYFFVICTCCGNPFFTKATSFQGSSIALKKTIVYTGCSPSIGNASGIRPFS